MRRFGWHHILCDIPSQWEVVRYANNPEEGSVVMSDRHGEALQVHWKRWKEKPDLARRLRELVAAQPDTNAATPRRIKKLNGWLVSCRRDEHGPTFAVRFLSDEQIVLVAVFPEHIQTDSALIERVLASLKSNTGTFRVWAAFGIDVRMPSSMRLETIEILPAMQKLTFENDREETIVVQRYGMGSCLPNWNDPAVFMAARKGRTVQLVRTGEFRSATGRKGVILSYSTRGSGRAYLGAMLARRWDGRIWAWRREDLERIYAVDYHGRHPLEFDNLYEWVREQ